MLVAFEPTVCRMLTRACAFNVIESKQEGLKQVKRTKTHVVAAVAGSELPGIANAD
jgi:hypothetical protein